VDVRPSRLTVVAHRETPTTLGLVRSAERAGLRPTVLAPQEALARLAPGDLALARLDVRDDLCGIERGLWELRVLEREGVRVLNPAAALVAAHDKLATAGRLQDAGLPHPDTHSVGPDWRLPPLEFPFVIKPRFGSWGRDVLHVEGERSLRAALALLRSRPWFAAAGAIAQEYVPHGGRDLRVVVAGRVAVGAIERVAAPGEWRTNVALGASRVPVELPPGARELAVAAAAATGADIAAVDLLPLAAGGHVVLEVNGVPDFTLQYRRVGSVFDVAVQALLGIVAERMRLASGTP
jgi:RimK family alpha-L-glutamate ligase